MTDPSVVVDASVLAAVVFGETRASEAAGLLAGKRLVAPELLRYEMCEVARAKSAARPQEAAAIVEQLEMAHRLPIVLRSPLWARLPQLALSTGLTAYDAAYLSVAMSLELPLVTFDLRLGQVSAGCLPA